MTVPYTYFYDAQFKTYIRQFLRVFSGLQVQYGVDRNIDGNLDRKTVKVVYGSMDRVVANVINGNGNFTSASLPMISGYMTSIELSPDRKVAPRHIDNTVYTDATATKKVASRHTPVPYTMNMELSIMASNTEQMLQIIEQILLLFNPYLNFQKSENIQDWSSFTKAELVSISNEENYPAGGDSRLLVTSLSFAVDVFLNFPMVEYGKIINSIITNVKDDTIAIPGIDLDTFTVP